MMSIAGISIVAVVGLFGGILVLIEVGRRVGVRRLARDPEGARAGSGAVDGALFAVFGLLVAFTFSGAAARFDARRQLIVEETNAIGTAWLRLGLLPADVQPGLRDLFRTYLDTRLATYRNMEDIAAAKAGLARTQQLQDEIWKESVRGCRELRDPAVTSLILTALNAMFDIVTTRTVALITHPPLIIFAMLFVLAWACALLVGFAMAPGRKRDWLHVVAFAGIVALTVYVTLDLEFPRAGLIRIDSVDRALVLLRESIGQGN